MHERRRKLEKILDGIIIKDMSDDMLYVNDSEVYTASPKRVKILQKELHTLTTILNSRVGRAMYDEV